MSNSKSTIKKFPRTFWTANIMELFERWAWYGLFAVLAVYLTNSTDEGALGFSQEEKGEMMGTVTMILYFLPVITGALADKLGFKKVLIVAYCIMGVSYFFLGQVTTFWSFYAIFLCLAFGAALFKPVISASVAKTTTKENASIGFGIFYMMVNVGGLVGPLVAAKLRMLSWDYVFYLSTASVIVNLLLVIFFYKEPAREENSETIGETILNTLRNIYSALCDIKLLLLLIIIIGFWTMFNQIFYTLPNFIEQWVDTRAAYDALYNLSPVLANLLGNPNTKTIPQEVMISLDAGAIVAFQVLISSIVKRFKPLYSMMGGILVCAFGVGLAFYTNNPFIILLGIFVFALGEMSSSPKFTEYIGSIAPDGKEGLYMGMSFIPVAIGNKVAGYISGDVYGKYSDLVNLLKREVAERGFNIPKIEGDFTINDYINKAVELMGTDRHTLVHDMWVKYQPNKIWVIFVIIGLVTICALFAYDRLLLRKGEPEKKMTVGSK